MNNERTRTVVRGHYNAITPFYKWHTVKETTDFAVYTACGLYYSDYSIGNIEPFNSLAAKTGDRCQTDVCGMKGT